jgi:hypothetical protein
VHHVIDASLEYPLQEERWMAVEHLHLKFAYRDTEDPVDPPIGLALLRLGYRVRRRTPFGNPLQRNSSRKQASRETH